MSTMIHPYLFFGGRCEEAMTFYKKALGLEVRMMMRFNQSPDPIPPSMLQPGFENKIMHADVSIQGIPLMMSDGSNDKSKFDGFRLAISFSTEAEARKVFAALADEGSVMMPLSKTFWSPCFGMLTDKFGLGWMVSVPGEQAK